MSHRAEHQYEKQTTLTDIQKDMLSLMSLGHSCKEVARICRVAECTVKTHLDCARNKLGTETTIHAVAQALRMKIIR